jgi:Ca2+/H+ antiporter
VELHKYDSSSVYMYGVLAGSILGVSLLVCGVVMAGGGVVHRSAWASVWTS